MSIWISANISGEVNSRMSSRLPASLAACRRMNCTLALRAKPATSKSAGMRACGWTLAPIALPIIEPPPWPYDGAGCVAGTRNALFGFWPAPAPAPAYAMPPPCWAAFLRIRKPTTASTAITSRPIMSMLASSSPKPRCEASAARPRPAARPATGPIQLRLGAAAAAAPVAPAAGAALGVASGALDGGVACRCMPRDLPPPIRLASASKWTAPRPSVITTASIDRKDFMCVSIKES